MQRTRWTTCSSFLLSIVLSMPALAACSTDDAANEESGIQLVPKVADQDTVAASHTTWQETGIAVWGVSEEPDGARFTGYDAHGRALVRIARRNAVTSPTSHTLSMEMTGTLAEARLELQGTLVPGAEGQEGEIQVEVTTNTFADSPRAREILERFEDDLDAPTSSPSLVGGGSLTTQGVISRQCISLIKECGKTLVKLGKPLLPCKNLISRTRLVFTCGVIGGAVGAALSGPFAVGGGAIGAGLGASLCASRQYGGMVDDTRKCIQGIEDIYNTWDDKTKATGAACGKVKSCAD